MAEYQLKTGKVGKKVVEENKHEKVSNNCIRYRDVPCRNRRSFLWGSLGRGNGWSNLVFDDRRNCLRGLCNRESGFVIGKIRR